MKRFRQIAIAFTWLLAVAAHANDATQELIQQGYELTAAGKLDEALTILQQAVAADPTSSLARTRLGGIRVLRQEYAESIEEFQQAIMLDQQNSAAFIGMAVAYLHNGDYSLAKASLAEAGNIDPTKQSEIERIYAWIEQRTNGTQGAGH